jgi:hypothetical protein
LPPDETPEQLRARLRRFALATRDVAYQKGMIPFPEHVSVLAGPLRRVRTRVSGAGQGEGTGAAADRHEDDGRPQ